MSSGRSSRRSRSGWGAQVHHRQPVVEVLPEAPGGHLRFQVAVGGGHHPDVDVQGLRASHALELVLLQHAQQLGLHGGRHVPHLVEEEGAGVGQFELPPPHRGGAGEGPPLVAEQLALDEALGHRRAVDADEGPGRAPAVAVERPGHQFLAGAVLAADEDAPLAGGRPGEQRVELAHRRPLAHHLVLPRLCLQLLQLRHRRLVLQRVAQREQQPVAGHRLLQEVPRPQLGGPHRGVDGGVPGHHDDAAARAAGRAVRSSDAQPVHVRHPHVQQDGVHRTRGRHVQGELARLRRARCGSRPAAATGSA